MNKLKQLADRALETVLDLTEHVAGTCPVCAFWRGVLACAVVAIGIAILRP